jgi:hypothetical protein
LRYQQAVKWIFMFERKRSNACDMGELYVHLQKALFSKEVSEFVFDSQSKTKFPQAYFNCNFPNARHAHKEIVVAFDKGGSGGF